ncbi:hypothetical protein GNI_005150 [Gregarina niphandrodes]|uniref:U4/U6.U5 small nuclear ribonucleoprotein 27kDa protein domain-containing protein n=1 Tax=Gregarina niphandrodes TaxID=110365 RepID=A0A023BDG0_GRENI|nr:hypothetical protein GNI_005150 [Gregarina niphandrodes]EZG88167.1 hypothetical protein GNI_005150 [Gregarina niphandrodes]|eukprot:XP_011128591.1 hypothetical protein GNI_005150 [Gregarina niphandrodes]
MGPGIYRQDYRQKPSRDTSLASSNNKPEPDQTQGREPPRNNDYVRDSEREYIRTGGRRGAGDRDRSGRGRSDRDKGWTQDYGREELRRGEGDYRRYRDGFQDGCRSPAGSYREQSADGASRYREGGARRFSDKNTPSYATGPSSAKAYSTGPYGTGTYSRNNPAEGPRQAERQAERRETRFDLRDNTRGNTRDSARENARERDTSREGSLEPGVGRNRPSMPLRRRNPADPRSEDLRREDFRREEFRRPAVDGRRYESTGRGQEKERSRKTVENVASTVPDGAAGDGGRVHTRVHKRVSEQGPGYWRRVTPARTRQDDSSEADESETEDPRAARRRMLKKLREEADGAEETAPDVQASEAWQRMLKEREASTAPRPAPDSEDDDGEGMDISDNEDRPAEDAPRTAEDEVLLSMMGFASFDSSKGKTHQGQDVVEGGVRKTTKRKYRQYMNRKGGFNRPLSPVF